MGLTTFYGMFSTFTMIDGIYYEILSIPQDNVMDLNNVVFGHLMMVK